MLPVAERPTRSPRTPRIMSYDEAEAMLKLSHASVYRLVLAGEIKAIEVGGRRRLIASTVESYIRRKAREADRKAP